MRKYEFLKVLNSLNCICIPRRLKSHSPKVADPNPWYFLRTAVVMKSLKFVSLVALCVSLAIDVDCHEHKKIVCFWNSTSFNRQGPGKFQLKDLQPALNYCTHLIYGYAGIHAANYEMIPLHPNLDTGAGYAFYRLVAQFKKTFPALKIYLSIGGNADPYEETHKYLSVIETLETRTKFISSVCRFLLEYDFDGIDLAWQFPPVNVMKNRGPFDSVWHIIKSTFGYGKFKDEKETVHREGFTSLVRDLKTQLRSRNKTLTITVLPHVNASVYYDARLLARNIDAVHLMAFDQKTPERNPNEADYPAPMYELYGRVAQDNIDSSVRYWLEHRTPAKKIIIGIPTFARAWKLIKENQKSAQPPIAADGAAAGGSHTQTPGLLSYTEVCTRLTEEILGHLKKVDDPWKKYGNYAYQFYNPHTGTDGIWIGYEDPVTAGNKAFYAKTKGLGGVAIFDLSTDDFRGTCTGDKYPIVLAVKFKLSKSVNTALVSEL